MSIDQLVVGYCCALACLFLGFEVGQREVRECPPQLVDGRRLTAMAADSSYCRYEAPVPYLSTLSPTELRRLARAREKAL